jgi:hypothetical protein
VSAEGFGLAVVLMFAAFLGLASCSSVTLGLDDARAQERRSLVVEEAPPPVARKMIYSPAGVYAE